MTLSKKEKELLNGLNLSVRGAREIISRFASEYKLSVGGLRNKDLNGIFIAETKEKLMKILNPLINQVNEEQKRITALANSDPEKSRELVKQLLEEV